MSGWGGGDPWGGSVGTQIVVVAPNGSPPIVGNFTPAAGTPVGPNTPIGFDVTDDQDLFRRIMVTVQYENDGTVEVAHDGDTFVARFAQLSTRIQISGGYRFLLQRRGGWPGAPRLRVYAFDVSGNEGN